MDPRIKPAITEITRDEAHARGDTRYFTGRPCRRGHVAQRFVANGACTQCVTWQRLPAATAPNMGKPPTGYPFPRGVVPTQHLVSAVHAKVLKRLPDLINEVEREWGMPQMREGVYLMTPKANGATRDAMILAGWNDTQLVAEGYMVPA